MVNPIIHICGPDWIWVCGPLEITFHDYLGPGFYWHGRELYPGRWNPVWLVFAIVRRIKG